MSKPQYSPDLAQALIQRAGDPELLYPVRTVRYEAGQRLELAFTTVWPEVAGRGCFRVEKFVGGGFAGQVYRCVLESVDLPGDAAAFGLTPGGVYAVKMMIPPSRFACVFRDVLYAIGFQCGFSAQVNEAACRAGLLWQRLARLAAGVEFGDADAVAEVHASFCDTRLGAYGEIREWVEGRGWRLEADLNPRLRRDWRHVEPAGTQSPEYVAKRQFMYRFVRMLRAMGARELARQYEWWTMKSQPNVLKRTGRGDAPAAGLCAVDFRAGLVLLPFLPMSPRDVGLIFEGLWRRSLVQFDRCDFGLLTRFANERPATFNPLRRMLDALSAYDRRYRRSMPDVTHQGWRLLVDASLRADVRKGLAEGYAVLGLADATFADGLGQRPGRFALYWMLGAVPLLGAFGRRLWGHTAFRRHVSRMLADGAYLRRAFAAMLAGRVLAWLRAGRCGDGRALYLSGHPATYWAQRLTIGWLPVSIHRALAEPSWAFAHLRERWRFGRQFLREAAFREQWLREEVEEGRRDGALDPAECEAILAQVRDPFIAQYLRSVGVHFCTLPASEIFWTVTGAGYALWVHLHGGDVKAALAWLATLALILPVSPGSIIRGAYVLGLMVRDRNFRDYMVAAPFSFLKILGYLAFPLQMVTSYPVLARFMASRWATASVHAVPVFGEQGALLEHAVFDVCFNGTHRLGRWLQGRMAVVLTTWLALGVGGLTSLWLFAAWQWPFKDRFNLALAGVCVFVLPRVLFYPLMRKGKDSGVG